MCVRACVIEKKLQERFRKVSFADSEKPEIIAKPGQRAPTHRGQNLRGLPKAHEKSGSLSMSQRRGYMVQPVAGGRQSGPVVGGTGDGKRNLIKVLDQGLTDRGKENILNV